MSGIEIAKRSMEAQKYAMDVIGHNIANVNTEGYTRQRAELETTEPVLVSVSNKNKPLASMGTGVKMVAVNRVRDEFLDIQQRNINQAFGAWSQEETNYSIIESIFNEPSDTAISGNLNRFWNGWQSLATPDPTSPGARSNLMSQGEVLANSLQQTHKQLQDLQVNTDKDIQLKVNQVNDIAQQIANMNANIVRAQASGNANDMLDKRNNLVGKLAKLVNIEYYEDIRGSSTIAIGGVFLVSNQEVSRMTTEANPGNNGYNAVKWESSGLEVKITDGELYGLIKTRDQTLSTYLEKLDTFASTLIDTINDLHAQGYGLNGTTGVKFFSGSDASSIAVNDELMQNSSLLAASSSPESPEGNGENAVLIGNIRNTMILSSNTVTLDQYYQNLVADIGTGSAEAKTYVKTNEALALQIAKEINSVSGVSIDEEMTNMIKAQQAYAAAAKYLTMVQSTMDTLLNLVGR